VFELLSQIASVEYIEYPYGKFITSINGVVNNAGGNGYYWQYWVNDELAPIAADHYSLSDGDGVLWKYCAPDETTIPNPIQRNDWWIGPVLIIALGAALLSVIVIFYHKTR
jgi:hypothetical protein